MLKRPGSAQFCKGEGGVKAFREKLQPFRDTLQNYQFLGGTSPCYADIFFLAPLLVSTLCCRPRPSISGQASPCNTRIADADLHTSDAKVPL